MTAVAVERVLPATMAGALHSNCRCLQCRVGYNEWLRDRRASIAEGTWRPFVDATPARDHIEALHGTGMSLPVIANLAKLHLEDVRRIRGPVGVRPRAERIRPDTEQAILSVELHFSHLPAKALIPTRGAARRVQALRAIGWPAKTIGPFVGLSEKGMFSLLVQKQTQVSTHLAVAALYEVWFDQDPVRHGVDPVIARRTRRHAARQRWAVPAAWGDIDTDEQPDRFVRALRYQKSQAGDRGAEVVEETAHLAGFGFTRDEITACLGIKWDAVTAAHKRAGVTIPAPLLCPPADL